MQSAYRDGWLLRRSRQRGRLAELTQGALADVIVVRGDRLNPHQALIDATPREVPSRRIIACVAPGLFEKSTY